MRYKPCGENEFSVILSNAGLIFNHIGREKAKRRDAAGLWAVSWLAEGDCR